MSSWKRLLCFVFLTFLPSPGVSQELFIRGDVNRDGAVGLADLIFLTNALNRPGELQSLPCVQAADVDDDGTVREKDITCLLERFLISDSPELPPPFPLPGLDFTPNPDLKRNSFSIGRGGTGSTNPGSTFKSGHPPNGGSDLQYIHFACRKVTLEPGGTVRVPVLLSTLRDLGGVTFALRFETGIFSGVELELTSTVRALSGGKAWGRKVLSEGAGYLAATCIFQFTQAGSSSPSSWTELHIADVKIQAAEGVPLPQSTKITFEGLPLPGYSRAVWTGNKVSDTRGYAFDLEKRSTPLLIAFSDAPVFVRGEIDGNGSIDPADAVFLFSYLFGAGSAPACLDAADVNDSGSVELGDGIYLLNYLWAGGPFPPSPFPEPGPDPSEDSLSACLSQPLGLTQRFDRP